MQPNIHIRVKPLKTASNLLYEETSTMLLEIYYKNVFSAIKTTKIAMIIITKKYSHSYVTL